MFRKIKKIFLERLRLRKAHLSNSISLGSQSAPLRIIVISNAVIPTLQLSLLIPLANDIERGDCYIEIITDQDIRSDNGLKSVTGFMTKWFAGVIDRVRPTCICFCRYSGVYAEMIYSEAVRLDIPTIYLVDDDLLNVPIELGNSKYEFHNDPKRLKSVKFLLEHVDLVYCSNERLQLRFINNGILGNFYAGDLFCAGLIVSPPELRPIRTIGYMGFDHAHDFEIVLPAIVNILRTFPDLKFELFGKIPKPKQLNEFGPRITELPVVQNYTEFINKLNERKWDIGICPLASTEFNLVKNVNKWIEYTSVGISVIATKDLIYNECCADDCGLLVNDKDWESALLSLIESPEKRFNMVKSAQAKLVSRYSVSKLRDQTLYVISLAKSNRIKAVKNSRY